MLKVMATISYNHENFFFQTPQSQGETL